MIISHGRRYIFVHAPKTGGTSLTLALEARAKADDILVGDTPKAKNRRNRLSDLTPAGRLWKHSTLRDIDGIVDASQMDDYFVFTIVRNPWDRMVSYYHWAQTQTFDHPVIAAACTYEFADFLMHPTVWQPIHAAPYQSYVQGPSGQNYCDLYLRLEHINADLLQLEKHLGLRLTLGHANASNRDADYRVYYTDTLRDHVARICQRDIEMFDYAF